ncbi:MAG: DUF3848 domain-containing protein [bacterium]|nr:DUF3848 domain-containing protein [bacterium]
MYSKKEFCNKVYEKIRKEYQEYKNNLINKSIEEVINHCYELTMKRELVDIFNSFDTTKYNIIELSALYNQKNTLDYLYKSFYESEGQLNNFIEDNIEIGIVDLATDYVNSIKLKLETDSNRELIQMITNALNDFDNYDFCNNLKNRYEIEEIYEIDIYEIFNSKGGKQYLYDLFLDLKESEQLQYLNEICVVDPIDVNNIKEKILPQLEEMLKEEKKNIQINKKKETIDSR